MISVCIRLLLVVLLPVSVIGTAARSDSVDDLRSSDFGLPEDSLVNLIQWSESDGGNGHWYAILPTILPWDWADSVARLHRRDGLPGYLATVTSLGENLFIIERVIGDIVNTSAYDEYCLGGVYENGSWSWITGEPFGFTYWAPDQPAPWFERG